MQPSANSKIQVTQMLAQAGLRRTPMRVVLLELLRGARAPLSVSEIIERLPESSDLVTVYRTLNTFTESRLVHRVRSEDRSWRYAIGAAEAREVHRHPHFVCDGCGTVECMAKSRVPPSLVRSLHLDRHYQVSFSEVVLHGRCPKCA